MKNRVKILSKIDENNKQKVISEGFLIRIATHIETTNANGDIESYEVGVVKLDNGQIKIVNLSQVVFID